MQERGAEAFYEKLYGISAYVWKLYILRSSIMFYLLWILCVII